MEKIIEQIYSCKGLPLQKAVNEISRLLENPIMMFDTSYKYICCTENYTTTDLVWNEFINTGGLSHSTMDAFNACGMVEQVFSDDVVSVLRFPMLSCERMNGKLFDEDGVQIGNISLVAELRPLKPTDPALAAIACEVLAPILLNSEEYKNFESPFKRSTFLTLLEGGSVDMHVLAELYDNLKPNLFFAVIDPSEYEKTNTHLGYFRDLFRQIQPEHKYFNYQHHVLMLVNTNYRYLSPDRDFPALSEFFQRFGLYAGVSGVFQDLTELKEKYAEATSALNHGLKSRKNQRVFNYESFRLERYLYANRVDDELISPLAQEIKNYDEENDTDLLTTFYMFLQYGRHLPTAAKTCGKSEEEVDNVVQAVTKMYGIDFLDGDMIANLLYSLRLLLYETEE